MKKRMLVTCMYLLLLLPTVTVSAYTAGTPSTGGGGGGGGGPITKPDHHPPYSTYTPKVTLLRNANALCADSGEAVYYIPTLDDLPLDLESYVTDCTDGVNSHQFAYVYSGYFNSDAQLVTVSSDANTAEAHTSQNIETAYLSIPALKDIGYDLLLVDDTYDIRVTSSTSATITNRHVPANSDNLTAKYVVMDLYKALGVYEYNLQLCFTKDPDFDANSSPILQEISVLTSQSGTKGLDITESRTDIAVSRTNAQLYWTRFDKDGVGRKTLSGEDIGGSQIAGLATPISADTNITFGQFCNLAVALMNLYGEEALPDDVYQDCLRAYNAEISAIECSNNIETTSAVYLLAKGILDPDTIDNIDWTGSVRLLDTEGSSATDANTIIDILGRIANKERRLPLKEPRVIDSSLAAAGYGYADIAVNTMITNYAEYSTDSAFLYDYMIEVTPETTHTCTYNATNTNVVRGEVIANVLETTSTNVTQGTTSTAEYQAYANMKMLVNGTVVEPVKQLENGLAGGYYYYGVETVDGKKYYHFKIRKFWEDGAVVTFDYVPSGTERVVKDVDPILLPDMNGGVYTYSGGTYSKQTFMQAQFTDNYIDSTSSINTQLASGNTSIIFYMTPLLNMQIMSNFNDGTFTWSNMYDSNGRLKFDQPITISNSTTNRTIAVISQGTAEGDYERVEITTSNPSAVRNSKFFKDYSEGESYSASGYYRATDGGSLMVSLSYLRSKGLVSGFKEVSRGVYVLTAGKFKTNVTILPNKGYIIIGDTMYPNNDGEVLVTKTNNETYINAKCCTGWAGEFSIVSTDDCIMAIPLSEFGMNSSDITEDAVSISTFFPSASTKTLYSTVTFNGTDYKGISMCGSYAVSPYMVVATEDDYDYLFVWHRNNLVSTKGDPLSGVTEMADSVARDKFQELTGITVDKRDSYSLICYNLDKNGNNNPTGFTYTNFMKHSAKGSRTATMGWLYDPPQYDDILQAVDDYASVTSALPIPIFAYTASGGRVRYYDANLNVCAESTGSDYLPLGTMPSHMSTSNTAKEKYYSILTDTGSYKTSVSAGESTKSYPIYTAPVGIFASLKGIGTSKAGDITAGSVYFGTSKCSIKDGKVTIAGRATTFDAASDAICTYMSNDSAAVYAVTAESTTLGDILSEVDVKIGYLLDDPENLVDWDKYTFDRLVQNLDAWSTVVLIFVLNILPRVCLLLFFILMLLSLIVDVKPWRLFCQRWFDIYKFLTMGHMSVDTVNTKKVFITSLICFALFLIIMDGQLFNFIIFIAKFFIALYQR